MILRLMLLLQLLLVAVGQFLRRRLKRSRRLKRIVRRMVAVQIFLGRIRIQMGIFFHGPQYFFFIKVMLILLQLLLILMLWLLSVILI
jgi:hypothetical protein